IEQLHRSVRRAGCRVADLHEIGQVLDLDRAVDTQVGTRAGWQVALQRDVDADRAALRGRVDARDDASDDAVARVDLRGKANREVTRLRFRDLQFGLQFGRVRHAGDVRAGRQLLADFDRQFLQLALHRRPDGEVAELALTQLVLGAQTVDVCDLRSH